MEEKLIHITSGRGPAECMWVVSKLLGEVVNDAKLKGIEATVLQRVNGEFPYTLVSATLKIQGKSLKEFASTWEGSILWTGQSTFRKFHKRKNWFVEVQFVNVPKNTQLNPLEIEFRTSRSSGPGGQHVNKTESAVRATHVASGLSVFVQDSRSQHQNKKIAIERLTEQYTNYQLGNCMDQDAKEWKEKISVQRGNPIKTFHGPKFQLKTEKL